MDNFNYIKDKTRKVCRYCGQSYKDYFLADESGYCDDCESTSAHCGFTNEPPK